MALEDFTVSQNTGHVEQATAAMTSGQLDDIERRAKASVTTVEVDAARAQSAEHQAHGAASSSEARVYGDIAADAAGLKVISTAAELLTERQADRAEASIASDVSEAKAAGIARNPIHIESDIALAKRPPGAYRSPQQQNAFGAVDAPAKSATAGVRTKPTDGEDLMARASITTMSLKDQHKEAVGSWDVKESKMASVQLAKKLTFGQELSNEHALQSVLAARQQHTATLGMVNQMSPGLSLASGPSIRPQDLLKMAEEEASLNRWRTQQS